LPSRPQAAHRTWQACAGARQWRTLAVHPYKGGVTAIQDTVAGQTQVLMNGMLATLPQVQNGKLKVLGVSKSTRMPLIGDVPTIAEQGIAL
jgi:tripartite-type tricarboxylate transporter receptor subunit TctC